MLVELDHIKGLPIGSLTESKVIGKVAKVIFDPQETKVIGFICSHFVFSFPKAISFSDVVDLDSKAVVVGSKDDLVELKELIRLEKLYRYKYDLIGSPVMLKSGKKLGRVSGAVIDSETGGLVRIFTRSIINHQAFDAKDIEKITLDKVVVKKEVLELDQKITAQAAMEG